MIKIQPKVRVLVLNIAIVQGIKMSKRKEAQTNKKL